MERIETARLLLRRWRPEDEAAMVAINEDPAVTRYLNRPVNAAATAAFYVRAVAHWEEHGFGFWAIELRETPAAPGDGTRGAGPARREVPSPGHGVRGAELAGRGPAAAGLIGFAGVAYPTFLPALADRPELGWRLARDAWGHGFATEAATAARDHAFATLGLPELISIIHPDNARSRRLATRLGMTPTERVHNPVLDRDVDVWTLAAPR